MTTEMIVTTARDNPDDVLDNEDCVTTLVAESIEYIRLLGVIMQGAYHRSGVDKDAAVARFIDKIIQRKLSQVCLKENCGPECPYWWPVCVHG